MQTKRIRESEDQEWGGSMQLWMTDIKKLGIDELGDKCQDKINGETPHRYEGTQIDGALRRVKTG